MNILKKIFRKPITRLLFDYMKSTLTVDELYEYNKVRSGVYSYSVFNNSFRKDMKIKDFDLSYHITDDSYTITLHDNGNELFRIQREYLEVRVIIGKLTKNEVRELINNN